MIMNLCCSCGEDFKKEQSLQQKVLVKQNIWQEGNTQSHKCRHKPVVSTRIRYGFTAQLHQILFIGKGCQELYEHCAISTVSTSFRLS